MLTTPTRRRGAAGTAMRARGPKRSSSLPRQPRARRSSGGPSRKLVVAVAVAALAVLLGVVGHFSGNGVLPMSRGMVVGDSMVAVSGRADQGSSIKLIGYSGKAPRVYGGPSADRMAADYAKSGYPKTVVLNWNGNNPYGYSGTKLVNAYRADIAHDIRWYFNHGVSKVVLAAAVPSAFNSGFAQTNWTSPAAATPGAMLGNYHLNDLYKQLAQQFKGKVVYTEAAARSIHPQMTFSPLLNGKKCIVDYIHPTPYCAAIYAHALERLANDPPS